MTLSPVLCLKCKICTVAKCRADILFSHNFIILLQKSFYEKSCVIQQQVSWDFHWFQLIVPIRAWGLKQGNRPKRCSVSESLLWALILDLRQRLPKSHSFEELLEKVNFWHFEETDNLIQFVTGWCLLALGWHCQWTALSLSPADGGWWHQNWNIAYDWLAF